MPLSNFDLVLFHYDLASLQIEMNQRGKVRIILVHRYGDPAMHGGCIPGEEIVAAWLIYGSHNYLLPLSEPHLILFDYIAKHSGHPQNARQIAEGLSADDELFYVHHGSNSPSGGLVPPRTQRTAVRKQVERIRERLGEFFEDNGTDLDPWELLRSELTSSNEVRYWIDAVVRTEH
jgi:hypothetical protein